MRSRPLIGVTGHISKESSNVSITASYMEGLFAAGALPLLLPITGDRELWEQAAKEMDGFLFSGGGDVEPRLYGELALQFCGEISPARDQMELDLLNCVLPTRKPVLGVCRGIQLLNVGMGGTLYQDIYAQNAEPVPQQHNQKLPDYLPAHDVLVEEGSLLHRIVKTTRLPVNTLHHQAVKDCAPKLAATGKTETGLVEALEMRDYPFFLGVQWHPERMWRVNHAAMALLQAFVDACSGKY